MKKVYVIFILIVLLGLSIRLYKIDIPLLEFYPTRQIQTAEITRNLYADEFNLFKTRVHYFGPGNVLFLLEFPLYNAVIALIYKLVGQPLEIYGRLMSIVGWLLASIFLFRITRRLTNNRIALFSLFIYSFSPLSVIVSRSFQPDQWMLSLSIGAIYFIEKWTRTQKLTDFYLSCFLASLSILVKLPSAVFTIIPIALLIYEFHDRAIPTSSVTSGSSVNLAILSGHNRRTRLRDLIIFAFIVLTPSVIWYLYTASAPKVQLLEEGFTFSNWFRPSLFIDPKYYSTIFGFQYNLGLLPIGIFLFLVGVSLKLKASQKLLYYWLAGVVGYFIIFSRHVSVHEYYHLPLLPIAAIFAGIGLEKIIKQLRGLVVSRNLLLFVLACFYLVSSMIVVVNRGYKLIPRFNYVLETANAIKNSTKPSDLIIGSMDAGPSLVYYSNRTGWSFNVDRGKAKDHLEFVKIENEKTPSAIEELKQLRKKGAKVFASANKDQFLSNKSFSDYMYTNYKVLKDNNKFVIFDLKN